jgi:hypothetical protein
MAIMHNTNTNNTSTTTNAAIVMVAITSNIPPGFFGKSFNMTAGMVSTKQVHQILNNITNITFPSKT